jgi:hypothetical protein
MKLDVFMLILAAFLLTPTGFVLAAPLPPEIIINDTTKECSTFIGGDECMNCTPPSGWHSLGYDREASCSENYTMVSVRGLCKGFEIEHCCTEGHSGASGDCQNMVRNDFTKECTFVKDASNYTLPVGWLKMPKDQTSRDWVCPLAYKWTSVNSTESNTITTATYGATNYFGSVGVVSSDTFTSNGDLIGDWYWLRDAGYSNSGIWTFSGLPATTRGNSIVIFIDPLVTNGAGGGPGSETSVVVKYSTASGEESKTAKLTNPQSKIKDPRDSQGYGYKTYGSVSVPLPRDGDLKVQLLRTSGKPEHVAVNKECCILEFLKS